MLEKDARGSGAPMAGKKQELFTDGKSNFLFIWQFVILTDVYLDRSTVMCWRGSLSMFSQVNHLHRTEHTEERQRQTFETSFNRASGPEIKEVFSSRSDCHEDKVSSVGRGESTCVQ